MTSFEEGITPKAKKEHCGDVKEFLQFQLNDDFFSPRTPICGGL